MIQPISDPPPKILVVDDEQHQLDTVCRGLFLYGYRCKGVLSVDAALEALIGEDGEVYDLVLTDLTMPGSSGVGSEVRLQRDRMSASAYLFQGETLHLSADWT